MNEDFSIIKLQELLSKEENNGLSITDIQRLTKFSRSSIRINLAKLEGAGKVNFRRVGMAKLYFPRKNG